MRIKFKNFRCYIDNTFDFGDNGIALISGPSGQGKSTIMIGIQFALFGTGNKIISYGKTSCSVELEFDDIKIIRTKKPNHLVVNDIYEDEAGQEVINKRFGDTFDVTGYIAQNALNSFIIMSPIEKLNFLEKFAFKDTDLISIKNRCKALISKTHDELIATSSQVELAQKMISEIQKPELVEFPVKTKDKERIIKNNEIKYKNTTISLKRNCKIRNVLKEELNDVNVLSAIINSCKENITDINTKIDNLNNEKDDVNFEGDEKLKNLEKELLLIISAKKLLILKEQYEADVLKLEEMKESEIENIKNQLITIDKNLWFEYKKDEISEMINDLKINLEDLSNLQKLRKEFNSYKVDEKDLSENKSKLAEYTESLDVNEKLYKTLVEQKELYSCPSCKAVLKLYQKKLSLVSDIKKIEEEINTEDILSEINDLKTKIKTLEKKITLDENNLNKKTKLEKQILELSKQYKEELDLKDIQEDLDYLQKYQISQISSENKKNELLNTLNKENFSLSYTQFEKRTEFKFQEIEKLKLTFQEGLKLSCENEIRVKLEKQKRFKTKLEDIYSNISKLEADIKKNNDKIQKESNNHIEIYKEIKTKEELDKEIEKIEKEAIELQNNLNDFEDILNKIKLWKEYDEKKRLYDHWVIKLDSLMNQEKEDRNKYVSATMLKDKILEAESIAILNIIESINIHSQLYLDVFFPENPISVRLLPFKTTKKSTKPQINLEIDYKGMECDIGMLSGGELSRVILAFTLALGEMFNTPLLLLDECTASLDQDMTNIVFSGIKENFKGKIVIIVAHQVVTGTFDKTVILNNI